MSTNYPLLVLTVPGVKGVITNLVLTEHSGKFDLELALIQENSASNVTLENLSAELVAAIGERLFQALAYNAQKSVFVPILEKLLKENR